MQKIIAKIVIGLLQVLSELPSVQRQEESFPDEWERMKDIPLLPSFTFTSLLPCADLGYYPKLALNTLIIPGALVLFVRGRSISVFCWEEH